MKNKFTPPPPEHFLKNFNYLTIFLLLFLSILAVVYAFYTGGRMTNYWAVNYYIPSYFDGFVRRAFWGTVFTPFDLRFNFKFIQLFPMMVGVLAILCLLVFAFKRKSWLILLLMAVFFISPAGGMMFNMLGCPDSILYTFLLISLYINKRNFYIVFGIFSLLSHEIAAFTNLPIMGLYLVLQQRYKDLRLLFVICLVVFGLIYINQKASVQTINVLTNSMKANLEGHVRYDYYAKVFQDEAISQSYYWSYKFHAVDAALKYGPFIEHLNRQIEHWRNILPIHTLLFSWVSLFPWYYFLFSSLLVCMVNALSWFSRLTLWSASLFPLLLGFFAYDIERWKALWVLNTVFCIFLIAKHFKIKELLWCLVALLFCIKPLFYFDGYKPRPLDMASIKSFPDYWKSEWSKYYKPKPVKFETCKSVCLNQVKPQGLVWDHVSNLVIPKGKVITWDFKAIQQGKILKASFDNNDIYEFEFFLKDKLVFTWKIGNKGGNGLALDEIKLDTSITFDHVKIKAYGGDGAYSVGHLVVE